MNLQDGGQDPTFRTALNSDLGVTSGSRSDGEPGNVHTLADAAPSPLTCLLMEDGVRDECVVESPMGFGSDPWQGLEEIVYVNSPKLLFTSLLFAVTANFQTLTHSYLCLYR